MDLMPLYLEKSGDVLNHSVNTMTIKPGGRTFTRELALIALRATQTWVLFALKVAGHGNGILPAFIIMGLNLQSLKVIRAFQNRDNFILKARF